MGFEVTPRESGSLLYPFDKPRLDAEGGAMKQILI
jgi:hypothetical protein